MLDKSSNFKYDPDMNKLGRRPRTLEMDERDKDIVKLRIIDKRPLKDIAELYGISRQRVHQIVREYLQS